MISAILIGRNDDHGGDFRSRAALSINLLAEQLKDDDEIIFVDWNSADDVAMLPQAISGSLTRRAGALMRIIRVCGDIHAEFVRRGAFNAIIPVVAYNAAIRRANSSNRWILITTADLLLVSRNVECTLSDIAARLPDGVYGLPRFELPRWIWRGLDPCDPHAAATSVSTFGKRLHLEEAIRLPPPVLFDAPGDFQLVLRTDLIAIDGLDEGMSMGVLGPDSNLLKRLELKGRKTASLEWHLAGYHCTHTLSPDSSHRVGRVENDMSIFFEDIASPGLPLQDSSWGLADRTLPQMKLSECVGPATTRQSAHVTDPKRGQLLATRLSGVAELVGFAQSRLYDTTPHFNRAGYPTRHVIPFLLDHIFDEAGPIYYVGANELLASLLDSILKLLEPHRSLRCFRPDDRAGFVQCCESLSPDGEWPLLIFDFGIDIGEMAGNPSIQESGKAIRQLLWDVRDRFVRLIGQERQLGRSRQDALRIVAVNAINTEFEDLVLSSLDCALSPFITRTRSGRVCPQRPVPVASHPAADHMAAVLGRRRGIHVDEFARCWAIAHSLARDLLACRLPSRRLNRSVDALLEWPQISSALAIPDHRIAEIRSRIAASREPPPTMTRRKIGNDSIAASKLASVRDWESPEWYDVAHWYLGNHRSYNVFQRHRRDWEHIHFLFCLGRFGILDTDAEIVVLAHAPSRLPIMLARRVRKVHLVNIGWKTNGRFLRVAELRLDPSLEVYKGLSDPAFRDIAAAALIAQNYRPGCLGAFGLRGACQALAADGMLGVSFDVCIHRTKGPWLTRWLHPLPEADDIENEKVRCLAAVLPEFKPIPSIDWSCDSESLELIAPPADWRWRHMTAEKHGRRITSAIRWFRRGALDKHSSYPCEFQNGV